MSRATRSATRLGRLLVSCARRPCAAVALSSSHRLCRLLAGEYYGRLLAWYTDGGFTDEYGVRHVSGHFYNISTWEFLNEMEHGLGHELYTLEYDNM